MALKEGVEIPRSDLSSTNMTFPREIQKILEPHFLLAKGYTKSDVGSKFLAIVALFPKGPAVEIRPSWIVVADLLESGDTT